MARKLLLLAAGVMVLTGVAVALLFPNLCVSGNLRVPQQEQGCGPYPVDKRMPIRAVAIGLGLASGLVLAAVAVRFPREKSEET